MHAATCAMTIPWTRTPSSRRCARTTKRKTAPAARSIIPPITLLGWAETPRLDPSGHVVGWSLRARSGDFEFVNRHTRMLGRRGVLSLNLVTEPKTLQQNIRHVEAVAPHTEFLPGNRYEDRREDDPEPVRDVSFLLLGRALPAPTPSAPPPRTQMPPRKTERDYFLPAAIAVTVLGVMVIIPRVVQRAMSLPMGPFGSITLCRSAKGMGTSIEAMANPSSKNVMTRARSVR